MFVARWKYSVKARLVAFALATAFCWLCTAGTLRHSDGCASCAPLLSTSAQAAQSIASLHRTSAQPSDDNCAACQWTQVARDLPADYTITVATSAVAYEPFAPAMPPLPSIRAVRHASLRAPPLRIG